MGNKYRELNQLQKDYLNIVIDTIIGIKKSNNYLSPSIPSALEDELNSLFNFNKNTTTTVDQTINIFNLIVDTIHSLTDEI